MYFGIANRKYWCLQEDGKYNTPNSGIPVPQDLINLMVCDKLIKVMDYSSTITCAVLNEEPVVA